MDCAETSTAESRQYIRESYAVVLRLRASVARADRAIANSQRIIEQHQASAPAMMDRAEPGTTVELHHASPLAAADKKARHSEAGQIAARIVQGFHEAGFGCELLSTPPLH